MHSGARFPHIFVFFCTALKCTAFRQCFSKSAVYFWAIKNREKCTQNMSLDVGYLTYISRHRPYCLQFVTTLYRPKIQHSTTRPPFADSKVEQHTSVTQNTCICELHSVWFFDRKDCNHFVQINFNAIMNVNQCQIAEAILSHWRSCERVYPTQAAFGGSFALVRCNLYRAGNAEQDVNIGELGLAA